MNTVLHAIFLVAAIGLAGLQVAGQKTLDVCKVWASSGNTPETRTVLGEFAVGDIGGYALKKKFRYEVGGEIFVLDAQVEYGQFVKRNKPGSIILVFSVTDAKRPDLDFPAARGGTTYGHKWGAVFVEQNIYKGDHIYSFVMTCNDGISKKDKPTPRLKIGH